MNEDHNWGAVTMPRGQVCRVDGERIDVRREPLVVRDGCAPERTPAGRWPSDGVLVRSEQFAVNEAIAELGDGGLFAVHAPPGTGVSEVYGDLVAAIVTERARRIAELPDPEAAFGAAAALGLARRRRARRGARWLRDRARVAGARHRRAARRLRPAAARDALARPRRPGRLLRVHGAAVGRGRRVGDARRAARRPPANRGFAERWWHGTMRGTDVLFPAGESMAAALRRLKGTAVYWPACVEWFSSAVAKADKLATERMRGGCRTHPALSTRAGLRGGIRPGRVRAGRSRGTRGTGARGQGTGGRGGGGVPDHARRARRARPGPAGHDDGDLAGRGGDAVARRAVGRAGRRGAPRQELAELVAGPP